eukprot:Plantae.Rhodophyta-Purpureofilum_apyrenoidigerum.ctg29467.p1 GENE.Plantae.Rhodophyta-Purpureofilum_apyrenoidigerum.ctg29467~~Plantae.Rhodophyta-Purpureofilum_apyrenoidigerum.ctg29467.p1  ORF type:complete len:622 (-),score=193.50 Plantae.Rhodophyta-Purpureofilum_apyrenoidigerum.ctg29467:125-1990(-)
MPRKKKGGPSNELKINEEYAQKFEARKRREELHRAESLGIQLNDDDDFLHASESESGESEDENAILLTKNTDKKIADVLDAIRRREKRVYDKNVKFFDDNEGRNEGSNEEDGEEDDESSGDEPIAGWDAGQTDQGAPKLTIKDYVREKILTDGKLQESSESESESESDHDGNTDTAAERKRTQALLYDDEQRSLRTSLQRETGPVESDAEQSEDDFFVKRTKTEEEQEVEDKEFDQFVAERSRKLGKEKGEEYLLHSYLERETLDEKERFLRDFVLNNGWLNRNQGTAPDASTYTIDVDVDGQVQEEEEFLDRQDEIERKHNFRFEEERGDQIISYARDVNDSVRRKDERRKLQREQKKLRTETVKREKLDEVKRLKNLKKAEIQSKLDLLKESSGGVDFGDIDLDGDFDADEFSKQMAAKFSDEYYNQEDAGLKHPFGTQEQPVETVPTAGDNTEGPSENGEEVRNMVQDYYNIGLHDVMKDGDLSFRYKEVEPESFGLSMRDILDKSDKELNMMISLRKLAPYRNERNSKKTKKSNNYKRHSAHGSHEPSPRSSHRKRERFTRDGPSGTGRKVVDERHHYTSKRHRTGNGSSVDPRMEKKVKMHRVELSAGRAAAYKGT